MLILQICWYLVFPDGSSQHSPQVLPMTEVSGSVPGSCLAPLHWGAGYLHPVHPLAKDHSSHWGMVGDEERVDNFGVYIPTFMSFFYFWHQKCFQITVQYWEWTKPSTVVEIVLVSLCMMQFWLTYQCSCLTDVWQQEQAGHSQFLCIKIFFQVVFQALSVLHCHSHFFSWPIWVFHVPTLSFLYEWTLHFWSVLFSETHSVFTPAVVTGWGIFLTNFFSLFGVLVFKQYFYVYGEKYYVCPTLKFFSSADAIKLFHQYLKAWH